MSVSGRVLMIASCLVVLAACGRSRDPAASPTMSLLPTVSPTPTASPPPSPSPTVSPSPTPIPSHTSPVTPTPIPTPTSPVPPTPSPPTPPPTAGPTEAAPAFPPVDTSVPVHGGEAIVVILAATEAGEDVDVDPDSPLLGGRLAEHGYDTWGGWGSVGCSAGAADLLASAGDDRTIDLVLAGYFADPADAEAFRAAWNHRYDEPVLAVGPVTTYCLD